MKAEQIFFQKRYAQKMSRIDIQQKTIEQYTEQAKSSDAQIAATDRQIELITEQRERDREPCEKGFCPKVEADRDRYEAERTCRRPR